MLTKFEGFNTGREYTKQGQYIIYSAEFTGNDFLDLPTYKIVFADISRGINHVIENASDNTRRELMEHYDGVNNLDYAKHEDLLTLQALFESEIKEYSQFDYGKKTGKLF